MTINTSNISLQITRGNNMAKNKKKKLKKRKRGGMTYQLYGGSSKDFSDGNKFIQSFYDKE
tara:strand:+ start:301 stop:483 length:183 start_codon:yes stop_codon:yes gene_type:complete